MTGKTFPAKDTALNDVLSPAFPLELTAEYAEEADALEMRLRWAGPEYNPLPRVTSLH